MQTKEFSVPAIHCGHCTHRITMRLNMIPGVEDVDASVDTKTVTVDFDLPATEEQILAALEEINYPAAR